MNLLDDTNQNDQIQIDSNIDPLEALIGPGGKFDVAKYDGDREAAIKAMAKGKMEGDLYIEHFKKSQDELRQDYTRMREEYNAGQSLKELIDQLKNPKQSEDDRTQFVQEDKSAALDLSKIEELVQSKIQATKQQEKEEANFNAVQAKLLEAYGPNYAQTLKQQVSQLGLTADFVNDLARKHPQVLYRTLGLDGNRQGENFQAPPASSARSDHFAPQVNKRTWSYYEKMRKTNPAEYFDPKTQDQMFKDATSLGDKFNDGGFEKRLTTI
jgi:hypothetical protein